MRFLAGLLMLSVAAPLWAEDVQTDGTIRTVTILPDAVIMERFVQLDLPSGRHRVAVPVVTEYEAPRVSFRAKGAVLTGTTIERITDPMHQLPWPTLQAGLTEVTRVEGELAAVQDRRAAALLPAAGAEVTLHLLRELGGSDALAERDGAALRALLAAVGEQAQDSAQVALEAEAAARAFDAEIDALQAELAEAEGQVRDLTDRFAPVWVWAHLEVAEAGPVELVATQITEGAGWQPVYDLTLMQGDTSWVEIDRSVKLRQVTGVDWEDVTLILSTQELGRQLAAGGLWPERRWIEDARPMLSSRQGDMGSMAEPAVEPVIIEELGAGFGVAAVTSDQGVTFELPVPVTLAHGGEVLTLDLDRLSFAAEVTALAVPRRGPRVYRTVTLTNSSGAELLPSEEARFHVDGVLVGQSRFARVGLGAEVQLGFGPINGLVSRRDIVNAQEGDRGLIARSNRQERTVEIEITNHTDRTWPLRVLDQVPYSEQEDLVIDWTAAPQPSETDVDKGRGILEWELDIAPGAVRGIALRSVLTWPDGMELR